MIRIILAVLLSVSVIGLGYGVEQSDFNLILLFYLIAFGAYAGIFKALKNNIRTWLILAIFLRLLLVFSFPNLSDDIYRFFWDGLLSLNGYNPYLYLPGEALEFSVPGLNGDLFQQLNSPGYYTVYPSISEAIYFLGALLSPNSIFGAAVVMKIMLLIAEAGTFYYLYKLLKHYKLPEKSLLIYALNPLVIVETFGNLHFEAFMFFFFIAALYYLIKFDEAKYIVLAGLLFGCSIATKLHTLMLLPFVLIYISRQKRVLFGLSTIISTLVLLSPLIMGVGIQAFGSSLDLYFQKFEFNASIYYVMRWVGYQAKGYNLIALIGPLLSAVSLFMIGGLWIYSLVKKIRIDQVKCWLLFLVVFCLFLFFTTTVHPWYLIIPIGLSVFTRFRFVLLWSFLITLTYINYSYPEYFENLWIVGLEYVTVGLVLVFEWYMYSKSLHYDMHYNSIDQ